MGCDTVAEYPYLGLRAPPWVAARSAVPSLSTQNTGHSTRCASFAGNLSKRGPAMVPPPQAVRRHGGDTLGCPLLDTAGTLPRSAAMSLSIARSARSVTSTACNTVTSARSRFASPTAHLSASLAAGEWFRPTTISGRHLIRDFLSLVATKTSVACLLATEQGSTDSFAGTYDPPSQFCAQKDLQAPCRVTAENITREERSRMDAPPTPSECLGAPLRTRTTEMNWVAQLGAPESYQAYMLCRIRCRGACSGPG
jgi:hypothetical protein